MQLIEAAIPLTEPFRNAGATVDSRRIVFVGWERDGITGWGEAAPFPGINDETIEDVWQSLTERRGETSQFGSSAINQASTDQQARADGLTLTEYLGGSITTHAATCAVGRRESVDEAVNAVGHAAAAGFSRVKLKVEPGFDRDPIAAVRESHPEVDLAVDANGSFAPDDPFFEVVDQLGLDYIEQPLAATSLDETAHLAKRIETPVALDEGVHKPHQLDRVISGRLVDMIVLKPGVLGPAHGSARAAAEQGMTVKASGLIETSIGRAHTIALAGIEGVTHVDHVPAAWFLAADVADLDETPGIVSPQPSPGIGFEPDFARIEDHVVRAEIVPT